MFRRKGRGTSNDDVSAFLNGDGSRYFSFAAEEWAAQLSNDELPIKKEDEVSIGTEITKDIEGEKYESNVNLRTQQCLNEKPDEIYKDSMYSWLNQQKYFLEKNRKDLHKLDLEQLSIEHERNRGSYRSKNGLKGFVDTYAGKINSTNQEDRIFNPRIESKLKANFFPEKYEDDRNSWEYEYINLHGYSLASPKVDEIFEGDGELADEEDGYEVEEPEVVEEQEEEEQEEEEPEEEEQEDEDQEDEEQEDEGVEEQEGEIEETEIVDQNEPSEPSVASSNLYESRQQSANTESGSVYYVEDINPSPYTLDEIESLVEVRHTAGKGRCLFTKHDFSPGNIILVELPVLVAIPSLNYELWHRLVEIHDAEELQLPPIWHLAAICSLTLLDETKKNICLDKWVPEDDHSVASDVKRVLKVLQLDFSPKTYGRMLKAWRYNSFGHHTEKDGLVLYNRISMMSHSCLSTACWHFGTDDAFILRARVNLAADEELTISYIGDEDLFKSTDVRREKLSGWMFCCMCKLCEAPVDVARGFRCATCFVGTVFLKMEPSEEIYPSLCTVCQSYPSTDTIAEYLTYESEYTQQISAMNASDINEVELCLDKLKITFSQHWLLFVLHTMLFEAYRDADNWDQAIDHQKERLCYVTKVMPLSSYTLAWLFEEMGDLIANKIDVDLQSIGPDYAPPISQHHKMFIWHNYENAAALLQIICGENHEYRRAALEKSRRIMTLPTV